jgi:GTPase-activating protein SST2
MTGISAGNSLPDLVTLPYTPDIHPSSSDDPTPPPSRFTAKGSATRRSLAGIALEKTSSVLATLTSLGNQPLRPSLSHGSLSKQSHKYAQIGVDQHDSRSPSSHPSEERPLGRRNTVRLVPQDTPKLDQPADSRLNKMHQTSSRLLRMTEDERPFTKVRLGLVRSKRRLCMLTWCRTSTICLRH